MNLNSQNLAFGTATQAKSAEEVTRAMKDITGSLRLSSDHALQSGEIAAASARDTEEGGRAVGQLVEAICCAMSPIHPRRDILASLSSLLHSLYPNVIIRSY